MASQRQAHNRKRQKAILVMAVALLIIVVIAIIGLTTFLKKYSASKEVTDYSKYYKLEQEDEMFGATVINIFFSFMPALFLE